ncbi:MAG: response regulator [Geobacteraceae bacterium]|nr:response regulator [Geobacteraceae bacterium]
MDNYSRSAVTVMIVDDEPFFRKLLRDILEKEGYPVVAEAVDGFDAVEKYREHRPEMTIMDIFMPGKYGVHATEEIIALDPQAKIVVCSAVGFDDDVQAAFKAGARALILKPFMECEVTEAIDRVMQAGS